MMNIFMPIKGVDWAIPLFEILPVNFFSVSFFSLVCLFLFAFLFTFCLTYNNLYKQ